MKYIKLTTLLLGFLLFGFKQAFNKTASITDEKTLNTAEDKVQIQNLIRQVCNWHESKKPSINEMITDDKDSSYIGFNLDQLKQDINELKATQFFLQKNLLTTTLKFIKHLTKN